MYTEMDRSVEYILQVLLGQNASLLIHVASSSEECWFGDLALILWVRLTPALNR